MADRGKRRVMNIIILILNIARSNNNDRYKGERKITIGPRNLITKEKMENVQERS